MLDPELVRRITYEMSRVSRVPITVKCRIGTDGNLDERQLFNFMHTVSQSGVRHFILHARNCILSGLSPHQNRTIPPLKYDRVLHAARTFPDLSVSINGGITSLSQAEELLAQQPDAPLNSCMIGRAAYADPWMFADADRRIFGSANPGLSRRQVVEQYLDYAELEHEERGVPFGVLAKPLIGLFKGSHGGHRYRHALGDAIGRDKRPIRDALDAALQFIGTEALDARAPAEDDAAFAPGRCHAATTAAVPVAEPPTWGEVDSASASATARSPTGP